jgi:hypothetical protein
MKKLFVLPVVLLVLAGLALTGCPTEAEPLSSDPFTFKYDGTLELPVNSWSGGSNNQAQLTGTYTGMITEGKTYNVKITGTLSHDVVLKVVLIDNEDGGWHILSNYGSVPDSDNPEVMSTGLLGVDGEGIVIKVTASATASGTGVDANKVVLLGEKDTAENDKSTEGLKITGATIQIAEEGKPYPEITQWEAPEGSKKIEASWTNGNEDAESIDLEFPYTTNIPANAEYLYSIYLPKGAAFTEGELQLKGGVTQGENSDWAWTEIGAVEAWGMAHIASDDFKTEGEYEVFHGVLTTVSGNSGDPSTAADHDVISDVHHILIQLTVKWVTYSGKIAVKLDEVRSR